LWSSYFFNKISYTLINRAWQPARLSKIGLGSCQEKRKLFFFTRARK
jgi:hypothetical protein